MSSGSEVELEIRPPAGRDGRSVPPRTVRVDAASDIRIGRGADLEVSLPFATVSKLHATLSRDDAKWRIVDLGGGNGTFLSEQRLPAGVPHTLVPETPFRIADVELVLRDASGASRGADAPRAESTATIALRLVSDLFAGSRDHAPAVVVMDGPSVGRRLLLPAAGVVVRVGRAPDCDLTLADDDASREHAAIERQEGGVFVRDLGSKNGTQVGGARVAGAVRLADGAVIQVGGTRIRFDDPEQRYLKEIQAADEREPGRSGSVASSAGAAPSVQAASVASVATAVGVGAAAASMAGAPGHQESSSSPTSARSVTARLPNRGTTAIVATAAVVLLGITALALWLWLG